MEKQFIKVRPALTLAEVEALMTVGRFILKHEVYGPRSPLDLEGAIEKLAEAVNQ